MESVSSWGKISKKCSLDLPPEEDVKPVDYILYDLVEGVTLTVVSVLHSTRSQKYNYPCAVAHLRTADHHGGRTKAHPNVLTSGS